MMKRSVSSEINFARNAVENTLSYPEIQKRMAVFHYDRKKMLEGRSLYQKVQMLQLAKQDKYGSQYASTDAFKKDMDLASQQYKRHLKTARLAFEDQRGVEETLQIRGKRKSDLDGWLEQAHTFYSRIGGYMEEITRYNITAEELTQTGAMVEALYASRQQQLQSIGEAQHATEQRNEARRELRLWMSRFKKTARVALQDESQLLEVLGILVPTKAK